MKALAILVTLVLTTPVVASIPENNSPIKIIVNNWTSQAVLANIAGQIFSQVGYKIKYVPMKSTGQWLKIKTGDADVQVEVREGTMAKKFNKLINDNHAIDAGSHDAKTREDWWYPEYIEEKCPGLPDWQALNKCAHLFSTEKNKSKGRYVAGPWEKPDRARIRALKMDFVVDKVKKGDDLWVALEKAAENKKPIVLFNWTPNWVEAKYKGKFVEFPEYSPECEKNSKWGVNPNFTFDCGNPKNGWLKKMASNNMKQNWPCAFTVLSHINFSNNMIAEVAAWVDVDNMTHQEAADKWIATYKGKWESWIPAECKS